MIGCVMDRYHRRTGAQLPEVLMQDRLSEGLDRTLAKTPEGVLAGRLRQEFEFSPAMSLAVVELARECLLGEIPEEDPKNWTGLGRN